MSNKTPTTRTNGNQDRETTIYRLIRRRSVLQKTGLTRSALYRAMDAGDFPRPVSISKLAVAWAEHEVDAWIQARLSERDSQST